MEPFFGKATSNRSHITGIRRPAELLTFAPEERPVRRAPIGERLLAFTLNFGEFRGDFVERHGVDARCFDHAERSFVPVGDNAPIARLRQVARFRAPQAARDASP